MELSGRLVFSFFQLWKTKNCFLIIDLTPMNPFKTNILIGIMCMLKEERKINGDNLEDVKKKQIY